MSYVRFDKLRRAALPICLALYVPLTTLSLAYAADPAAAPSAPAPGVAEGAPPTPFQFILSSVNFFLIAFFVYYMLVLRPQQVKQEEQLRFIRDLKKDDEVVTSGGIFGRVREVSPESITVEVANGVRIRVQPQHVSAPKAAQNPSDSISGGKPAEKERKAK
ncbi:MAG: preprotein translocase subunit YajC [Bdellovibrionota bacterium]